MGTIINVKFIPNNFKEEYKVLEQIDAGAFKILHENCGREGRYYRSYFKEDIPCRHCKKEDKGNIIQKMNSYFEKKLNEFTVVDESHATHNKCGNTINLPANWRIKNNSNLCQICFRKEKKEQVHLKNKLRVSEVSNGEYEMIGRFEGFGIPVVVRHNGECGHEYPVTMNDFLNKNSRCPVCTHRTVTEEMFYERLANRHPSITLVGEYTNMSTETTFFHSDCKKEFSRYPKTVLGPDNPCPYCNNTTRDIEVMREKIQSIDEDYDLLTFESAATEAMFLHKTCGTRYSQLPSVFIHGNRRCPECSRGGRPRVNPDTIIVPNGVRPREKRVQSFVEENFPNFTYLNANTLRHNECGKEIPFNLKADRYKDDKNLCKECATEKNKEYWNQKQKQHIHELTNGEYELISDYETFKKPVILKHTVSNCGHEFPVVFHNFVVSGTRCPECKSARVSEDKFWQRFEDKFGEGYELLSEYINLTNEVTVRHVATGKTFTKVAKELLKRKKLA